MRKESAEMAKQELVKERVPDFCPFCMNIDGIRHSEFGVELFDHYWKTPDGTMNHNDVGIRVFCSRCEEEIRKEDVKDGKDEYYEEE